MKRLLLFLSLGLLTTALSNPAKAQSVGPVAVEAGDTRTLWVYESGWFEDIGDHQWVELNHELYNDSGEMLFVEVSRNDSQVTLFDKSRNLTVILTEGKMKWRVGESGDFNELYQGRWKILPKAR